MPTKIEWATDTWNPITGCTPISEGCQNCYAKRMSKRLAGRCGYPEDDPFAVTLHPDKLGQPLRWKKPRRVFVCSMGDLFHPDVDFSSIRRIWATMTTYPRQHTYLILTKRPERMKQFFEWMEKQEFQVETTWENIWLGVTAENQQRADERIPILLQIPAAKRFVSIEPMLGPVDINRWTKETCTNCGGIGRVPNHPHIPAHMCQRCKGTGKVSYPRFDWVICGGETGPGARPMHPDWVRSLRDQCQAAGVPFFFKSWGDWYPDRKGLYHAPSAIFGDTVVHKLGKKAAGRLLDGQEWEQHP